MGLYKKKSKELESLREQLKLNPDNKELYKSLHKTLEWIRRADRAIFEGKNNIGVNTGNYKSNFFNK